MTGNGSLTVMVTVAVSYPLELLALTVYAVCEESAVGVPEIAPVDEDNERPAGREGEIDQDVTDPVTVGVTVFIAVPCVKENVFGEYEIDGAERPEVDIGIGGSSSSSPGS